MSNETVEYMLTTVDNPFNPFTQFDAWFAYDQELGYNTTAFLGRVVKTSEYLPEPLQDAAVQQAIDEIVTENVLGVYRKVPNPMQQQKSNPS